MNKIEFASIKSYIEEEYKIGSGTFGDVYKGAILNQHVAIKKIKIIKNDDKEKAINEAINLNKSKFEFITELYTTVTTDDSIYFILEYMDGGNLDSLVHSEEYYCFKDVMIWFCCAAKALDFLHTSLEIFHRDVKPKNMLLDKSRKTLKLCDFGISKVCTTKNTKGTGTADYMAPEVFYGQKYDTKADIFSLSVSLAETLIRDNLYKKLKNMTSLQRAEKIYNGERPDLANPVVNCTEEVRELIKKGWSICPKDRPTAKEFENLFERSKI